MGRLRESDAAVAPGVPRSVEIVLFALVVLKATAYWWGSVLALPDDPFSTFVMYRGQDIQSFPLIHGLSRLNPGEPGVLEWIGHGISSRFVPYLPHAVLFAVAGAAGFAVADLVITVAAYVLLVRLFLLSGVGSLPARVAAVLLVCLTGNAFGEPGPGLAGVDYLFWGLRIPRPFVSDLFAWAALIGALILLRDLRSGARLRLLPLALIGAGLALLLQADVFTAGGIGLGLLIGLLLLVLRRRVGAAAAAVRLAIVAGCGAIVSLPLLIGLAGMPADMAERLGFFPVSRLSPPMTADARTILALAGLIAFAAVMSRTGRTLDPDPGAASDARWLFALLAVGALLALPVTALILGQATQIYHYPLALTRSLWLAAIVTVLHLIQRGGPILVRGRPTSPGRRRIQTLAALAIVIGPCLVSIWRLAFEAPLRESHMRTDVPEYAELTGYRRAFVELTRDLPASSPADPVVIATFDHQLWSWWLTFRDGYSYLADACTTTLPQAEIEARLVTLARLIGMTREQFVALASRRMVLSFWHSCARYQANALYTWSTRADYDPADRVRIASSRPDDSFSLVLPLSERRRLGELFDSETTSDGRLDIVVLADAPWTAGLAPDEERFERFHDNGVFTAWRRRM